MQKLVIIEAATHFKQQLGYRVDTGIGFAGGRATVIDLAIGIDDPLISGTGPPLGRLGDEGLVKSLGG